MKKTLLIIFIYSSNLVLSASAPKVSIITSIFNGDLYIESFMQNITEQTIFNECQLILINANSPGKEEDIINQYLQKHPNITYLRLPSDPGLYAVWNKCIRLAKGEYIINANLDDGLRKDALELFAKSLDEHPEIDLVYSDVYLTLIPNTPFENLKIKGVTKFKEFSNNSMIVCPPLNHPMWRKSVHERFGLFDETYKTAGDFEMWLRAISGGSNFLKIDGVYGYLYMNFKGLSHQKTHVPEVKKILNQYKKIFNLEHLSADQVFAEYTKKSFEVYLWYQK